MTNLLSLQIVLYGSHQTLIIIVNLAGVATHVSIFEFKSMSSYFLAIYWHSWFKMIL